MLRSKKNSYQEFDEKKKNPAAQKSPLPPPHNFSNGPSLSFNKSHYGSWFQAFLQTPLERS